MAYYRLIISVISFWVLLLLGTTTHANITQQPNVQQFIHEMVQKYGFNEDELVKLLGQATIKQDILTAIARPAEGKPWYQYRPIFLTPERTKQGVEFWQQHSETLARAEEQFGVPPQIIVAILGVETSYGRNTGKYRVLDALSTLAFSYPKRADFFRSELKEFLLLTREEKLDPLTMHGSYAGAIGQPQFISSSYRNYAVDFSGKGQRDLIHNTSDVIGSVANYFAKHGWQNGKPVILPAIARDNDYKKIYTGDLKPRLSINEWGKYGVDAAVKQAPNQELAALVELQSAQDSRQLWLGLNNFYVITRYNHSPLYAMAVYQLSEAIVAQKKALEG